MVMELQFHFRFNSLLTTYNPLHLSMQSLKKLHFSFVVYVLLTGVQVYFAFSNSSFVRYQLSKRYPALKDELLLPQTVAISPEYSPFVSFFYYYSTISIGCHGIAIISLVLYCYVRLSSATTSLSAATKKTARYYLKCLIIQFCVHSTMLYGPFVMMYYIQYIFQILNRDITNVGMICVSMHGSCSILTMLLVMTNYREHLYRIVTCTPPAKENWTITRNISKIAVISTGPFFSCFSRLLLVSPMFFWLCGMTKKEKKERDTLSELEIKGIRDLWNRAKKRGQIGQNIFKSLIELKPAIKDYFNIKVAGGDAEGLMKCEAFQAHAARIENFLDVSVGALGSLSLSTVGQMAHRIGSVHFYRGVNFGADNWLAFKKVIIEQILRNTQRATLGTMVREESFLMLQINGIFLTPSVAAVAWEKFMGYVIREMKKGFLAEATRNCREDSQDFI